MSFSQPLYYTVVNDWDRALVRIQNQRFMASSLADDQLGNRFVLFFHACKTPKSVFAAVEPCIGFRRRRRCRSCGHVAAAAKAAPRPRCGGRCTVRPQRRRPWRWCVRCSRCTQRPRRRRTWTAVSRCTMRAGHPWRSWTCCVWHLDLCG